MKSADYWPPREAARQAVYDRAAAQAVRATKRAMERALETLKREMKDILRVYVKRHKLTRAQALKLLHEPVDDKTRADLMRRIAQTDDAEARRFLRARIEAPAYSARLTRAQAMADSITLEVSKVAAVQAEATQHAMQTALLSGYDRLTFDVQQRLGRLFPYAQMSAARVTEVLKHQWLGDNYSTRVWTNMAQLGDRVQTCVLENMMGGKTSKETYNDLLSLCGQSMYKANRLIRTETSFAANQGEKQAYKEAGIERYVFVAALEARTCQECGALDGQVFMVDASKAGNNYPPMHPFCRCTTRPCDEDMLVPLTDEDTRWARDPVTGKAYEVPMTMTYEEWRKRQNELYGANTVETQRRKLYNRKADIKRLTAHQKPVEKKRFTSGRRSGIMQAKEVGKSVIEAPIEQRNSAKGKPNAILHFDRPLNHRQALLLQALPDFDSRVILQRKNVSMKDLAALTAKTGDEYALFTKGNQRLVIRGSTSMTNINEDDAMQLAAEGYRWSGHTHPGIDFNSLTASSGDYVILSKFKQKNSMIANSSGVYDIFGGE